MLALICTPSGWCFFIVLPGKLPFASAETGEFLRRHGVEKPSDVRTLRPDVSADLATNAAITSRAACSFQRKPTLRIRALILV